MGILLLRVYVRRLLRIFVLVMVSFVFTLFFESSSAPSYHVWLLYLPFMDRVGHVEDLCGSEGGWGLLAERVE